MGTKANNPSAAAAVADANPTTGTGTTTQVSAAPATNDSKTNSADNVVIGRLENKLAAALADALAKGSLAETLKEELETEKQKSSQLQETLEEYTNALFGAQDTIKKLEGKLKRNSDEGQAEKQFYTANDGTEYLVTVPEFRFQGVVHNSAEVANSNPALLETLIEAGNSILKKVE
jgi:hypothetical protein